MEDVKVFLELEKVISIDVKESENPETKISESINEMIELDKKRNTFLSTFKIYESEFEIIEEGENNFTFVKKAIDSFDPYFVHPDSYDEYDGESKRIAGKIKKEMSIDEIAEIMKEEFNWSFSAKFTREDFSFTAEKVYNFIKDSIDKSTRERIGDTKRINVYIKLTFSKLTRVEVLENEDRWLKVIEKLESEIGNYKERENALSDFNISII